MIKLPSSPLDPLRDIIRMGRERVEKAGSDIRSLADELRSGFPGVTSTIQSESPLPAAMPQPSEESPPARIATACVACAVGHFSTSSGLLKEALRFKGEGMTSQEILDRIAVNLTRSAIIAERPSPVSRPIRRFNQLIRYEFPVSAPSGWYDKGAGASRIFARDIYMKDIKSRFSYNLWGFAMAPDRHGPKNEADLELAKAIATWFGVNKVYVSIIPPSAGLSHAEIAAAGFSVHADITAL
jgi:hypothetical protein